VSALDDAVATHMAHAAGSLGDPLSDSLTEQQGCTRPVPLADEAHPALLQADTDTSFPPGSWLAAGVVLLAVLLLSRLYPWGFAPAMP
jgi:hypothetical protein